MTTQAKAGIYSYFVNAGSANDGVAFTTATQASAAHYASVYARDVTGTLQASVGRGNFNSMAVIGGATGGWVRYGVALTAGEAAGSTTLIIRNTTN